MNQMKISFLLLFALFACALAWAGGKGSNQGFGGRSYQEDQGFSRGRGFSGEEQNHGLSRSGGRNGRQNRRQDDFKKYRSNLYSDDDVYGYDATYPNGEAVYINYRSKDARAIRGPEFARTSRAYSRQRAIGERDSNFGQMNEYKGGGGTW